MVRRKSWYCAMVWKLQGASRKSKEARERETERQRDRETERDRERQRERERERERRREGERERGRERERVRMATMSERREGRCLLCSLKMLDFGVGVQEASKLSPRDLIAG